MKYGTILLDFDDTLIDTVYSTRETVAEIYEAHNLYRYYQSLDHFYRNVFRPTNVDLWRRYEHGEIGKESLLYERFHHVFKDMDEIGDDEAATMNADYLERAARKAKILPGAIEVLDYLKPKYKLVLLSNGFTELQYSKIENCGMAKYFDKVVLSDQAGASKPHPDIFQYALNEAHSSPEGAVMMGDNYDTDITGAHNAGISQIWYNPLKAAAKTFEPTYMISDLLEVKKIL